MVDDYDDPPKGTRKLYVPDRARNEDEYEALREVRRNPNIDSDVSFSFSEQAVVETAEQFERLEMDAQRLLHILHQPSPDHGIPPEDIYPDTVGKPRFPEELVQIDMDDIHWLRDASRDALQRLEHDGSESVAENAEPGQSGTGRTSDESDRVYRFLKGLEEFCERALYIDISPKMMKN